MATFNVITAEATSKLTSDFLTQILFLQAALEKECPDIMKLGLLHVVGVRKATARKQPAFLSYEHKSLQEFGASKFVTKRLETAENMKVSLDLDLDSVGMSV